MDVKLVVVGKIKEKFYREAIAEYQKRLTSYCKFSIVEVDDEKNNMEIDKVLELEAQKIKKHLNDESYKILLDINAKQLPSDELAKKLDEIMSFHKAKVTFIIGGSHGVSDQIKQLVDMRLSFSKMTFPHQLFRVILIEQIYRAFKILKNEPYHK